MLCVWSAFLGKGGESYFTFGPNIRVAPPQKKSWTELVLALALLSEDAPRVQDL